MPAKAKDITNQRFGRLTALRCVGRKHRRALWLLVCDCGNYTETTVNRLTCGNTKSCGCLQTENQKRLGDTNRTHGKSKGSEYRTLRGIKDRCANPKDPAYPYYGGRGIQVCDRWISGCDGKTGFECFLEDMGQRPTPAHTIERKDNCGPYSKENCVWALPVQQANNRRNNRIISHDGTEMTLAQWAREKGMTPDALSHRIRNGWSIAEALERPFDQARSDWLSKKRFAITDFRQALQHFADHPSMIATVQRLANEEARSRTRKPIPGVEYREEQYAA